MASTSSSRHLPTSFPTEVWEMVFEELDVVDLAHSQMVCRSFSDIIHRLLCKLYELLSVNRLVNCIEYHISLNLRRHMLHCYHRAWEQLACPEPRRYGNVMYTVLAGAIRSVLPAQPIVPQFLANGWMSLSVRGDLRFFSIPAISSQHRLEGLYMPLTVRQLPASQLPPYSAYKFDPSQDLLILVGHYSDAQNHPDIHVLSISTGLQHPLAHRLTLAKSSAGIYDATSFRIRGDLCAILARVGPHSDVRNLHVWNWKTGRLIYRYSSFVVWGDILSFIADRTLLVVDDETLLILTFNKHGDADFRLLALPPWHEEALQMWTAVSEPYPDVHSGRPFAPDPTSEFVVINSLRRVPRPGAHSMRSVVLAIRISALLKYAHSDSPDSESESESESESDSDSSDSSASERQFGHPWLWSTCISWHEWGPCCCRFFDVPQSWDTPATYGRRFAMSVGTPTRPVVAIVDLDVDTPHVRVCTKVYETAPEWKVTIGAAGESWDSMDWFMDGHHRYIMSDVPFRSRCRWLPGLPAPLLSASLWENGVVLKLGDTLYNIHLFMPLML